MATAIVALKELARVCDRSDAYARPYIYADSREGFALEIRIRAERFSVVRSDGSPLRFRTIDLLLDALIDIPNISPRVMLDIAGWAFTTDETF